MVDCGQYDARRPVIKSEQEQDRIFRQHRERCRELQADVNGLNFSPRNPTMYLEFTVVETVERKIKMPVTPALLRLLKVYDFPIPEMEKYIDSWIETDYQILERGCFTIDKIPETPKRKTFVVLREMTNPETYWDGHTYTTYSRASSRLIRSMGQVNGKHYAMLFIGGSALQEEAQARAKSNNAIVVEVESEEWPSHPEILAALEAQLKQD